MQSVQQNMLEHVTVNDPLATVIRIKRKRQLEPVNALLVACKKRRCSNTVSKGGGDPAEIENSVFRFAATIESKEKHNKDSVLEKVNNAIQLHDQVKTLYGKRDKSSFGIGKLCSSLQNKPSPNKRKKKIKSLLQDHHREIEKQCYPAEQSIPQDDTALNLSLSAGVTSNKTVKPSLKSTMEKEKCLPRSSDAKQPNEVSSSAAQDVYCNSVKMLREKLQISDAKDDDYVYDLYYCTKRESLNFDDILYFKPYSYLDYDDASSRSFEEVALHDDEDDSNDEDNWRNDYPDDEDSFDEDDRRLMFDEDDEELFDSSAYREGGFHPGFSTARDDICGDLGDSEDFAAGVEFDHGYDGYQNDPYASEDDF